MKNVMIFISKYCNYNKQVIRTTTYSKVIQRLAFWLLTEDKGESGYKMPGTQEVFADILQTNRSSLNQELQKLCHMDAILLKGRIIKIINRQKLINIINENI
ncbi:winged helix-turn-helix domain-containing protein [Facklamia sp. DSM 111018]|uniref:Winged helix-turn-helix domain-containing protein n=1 Tax=Facklamia lactis TaxID=2749967 RepID=A0ABS0LS39_9LACT|nr:helix-turn-helix domain-containing protein [Facklamia lactis]MBG9981179.1 winged helix-turn-helix domain-containing protein [Facklamia lactis]MBG9986981.1 winged helix-turn-helix domain-containing protein [Facklamia lactis]